MPYRYLEDIATADAAFEAWGDTPEEMFLAATDAAMNVMVADLNTIEDKNRRPISLQDDAMDMLLFQLLQELIYYKDAEQLLLRIRRCDIKSQDGHFTLNAQAYGEKLDPAKHDLIVDVKAVTLHRFRVEKSPRGWETLVILDI